MSEPKADCPDFKPSPLAAWMCAWWELEEETGEYFCSRPDWEDRDCPTAGLRTKPRSNYQPSDEGGETD